MARNYSVLTKQDIVKRICKKYRIANVNAVRSILDEYDKIRKDELLLGHSVQEPYGLTKIKRRKINTVFLSEEQKEKNKDLYTVKVVTEIDPTYKETLLDILLQSDDDDLYK